MHNAALSFDNFFYVLKGIETKDFMILMKK